MALRFSRCFFVAHRPRIAPRHTPEDMAWKGRKVAPPDRGEADLVDTAYVVLSACCTPAAAAVTSACEPAQPPVPGPSPCVAANRRVGRQWTSVVGAFAGRSFPISFILIARTVFNSGVPGRQRPVAARQGGARRADLAGIRCRPGLVGSHIPPRPFLFQRKARRRSPEHSPPFTAR